MSDIDAQKPALTIDLVAPEGNVYALIGKACETLEQAGQAEQSQALGVVSDLMVLKAWHDGLREGTDWAGGVQGGMSGVYSGLTPS